MQLFLRHKQSKGNKLVTLTSRGNKLVASTGQPIAIIHSNIYATFLGPWLAIGTPK